VANKVLTINRTCADFTVGVQHLTTLETGAYNLICDTIVTHGQDNEPPSLPYDDVLLGSVTKLGVRAWRQMKPRLCDGPLAVLIVADGQVSQARVVEEIANAKVRMDSAIAAGRASGESRRRKSTVLRERMANGRSTPVQTPVATSVQRPLPNRSSALESGNRTDREPVMSHESRKDQNPLPASSSLDTPARSDEVEETPDLSGLEGIDMLRQAVAICCPMMDALDDFTASRWLRDFNRDPWWIACAIFDAKAASVNSGDDRMAKVKTAAYVTKLVSGRATTGWKPETNDVRGFVEFNLRTLSERLSSTAP